MTFKHKKLCMVAPAIIPAGRAKKFVFNTRRKNRNQGFPVVYDGPESPVYREYESLFSGRRWHCFLDATNLAIFVDTIR